MGMLAQAVGPNLTKLLHDQLELMFNCGLSEPLRQALVAIATHIPPLLKTIQGTLEFMDVVWVIMLLTKHIDRLLDSLSIILSGHAYKPLGAPPSLLRGDSATVVKEPVPLEGTNSVRGPELITLALTTLHTFDFSGM